MTVLVLAGTGEAKDIASGLLAMGVDAVASLAGATRLPKALALPTRVGGFGGADGFRAYLAEAGITAVLDATHPFAAQITARSAWICAEEGLPYLLFTRPQWEPEAGDCWTFLEREEEAAAHIKPGQTAFLGTGRQTLERFSNLKDVRVICRQIDPPNDPFPFPGGQFLVGRPPFPVADEIALFKELAIDWLVVKNAGGARSKSKLVAARKLGIPVLMIRRPPVPDVPQVTTIEEAISWAKAPS